MKARPTVQHYVPQFLLRNFASSPRGKQIFVFDKSSGRSFPASINAVASKRAFYDFEVAGSIESVDPLLTKMESVTSTLIAKIVRARNLRGLSHTDKKMVALFATVQKLRTDSRRKQLKSLMDNVHDALTRAGMDPNKVDGFEFLDEEQTRVFSITSLPELTQELMPRLLDKSWILLGTSMQHPFYISDNPVTLFNQRKHPVLSTLGLGVSGIEIYLPLSSTLCLGFLCPTIRRPIRVRIFGGTLGLTPANVTHHNSLQVYNAERFVFSTSDEFALVREMLQNLPDLKRGPRLS